MSTPAERARAVAELRVVALAFTMGVADQGEIVRDASSVTLRLSAADPQPNNDTPARERDRESA